MRFQVTFVFNHTERSSVIIEAASREEAEKRAEELTPDDIDYWEGLYGEMYADSIKPLNAAQAAPGRAEV